MGGLGAPDPSRPAGLRCLSPGRPPSSGRRGSPDPRPSGGRVRFFLPDQGVQLVQLRHLRPRRNGCRRPMGRIGFHPVDHTLRIDLQDSSNRMVAVAFHLHAQGQPAGFRRIPIGLRTRRIDPPTATTLIPLAPRTIEARLALSFFRLAIWTPHTAHSISFQV
jgi:hypothetical protein